MVPGEVLLRYRLGFGESQRGREDLGGVSFGNTAAGLGRPQYREDRKKCEDSLAGTLPCGQAGKSLEESKLGSSESQKQRERPGGGGSAWQAATGLQLPEWKEAEDCRKLNLVSISVGQAPECFLYDLSYTL